MDTYLAKHPFTKLGFRDDWNKTYFAIKLHYICITRNTFLSLSYSLTKQRLIYVLALALKKK